MALPDNSHHVHSDGYYSDKGDPDPMRMVEEVADEIEQIDGVILVESDKDLDGPYIEVKFEHDCERIETVADDTGCTVVDQMGNWLEVRPD